MQHCAFADLKVQVLFGLLAEVRKYLELRERLDE